MRNRRKPSFYVDEATLLARQTTSYTDSLSNNGKC